jgi:hypothetical protein
LVDRALGELVRMHARIGHKEELHRLLDEIKDRPLTGPATERIAGAKEGLWMMEHNPGVAYLCGPKALESIIESVQPAGVDRMAVTRARSGPNGYSLAQVEALAKEARLPSLGQPSSPGGRSIRLRAGPGRPIAQGLSAGDAGRSGASLRPRLHQQFRRERHPAGR